MLTLITNHVVRCKQIWIILMIGRVEVGVRMYYEYMNEYICTAYLCDCAKFIVNISECIQGYPKNTCFYSASVSNDTMSAYYRS